MKKYTPSVFIPLLHIKSTYNELSLLGDYTLTKKNQLILSLVYYLLTKTWYGPNFQFLVSHIFPCSKIITNVYWNKAEKSKMHERLCKGRANKPLNSEPYENKPLTYLPTKKKDKKPLKTNQHMFSDNFLGRYLWSASQSQITNYPAMYANLLPSTPSSDHILLQK